jgi:hypothetical protein
MIVACSNQYPSKASSICDLLVAGTRTLEGFEDSRLNGFPVDEFGEKQGRGQAAVPSLVGSLKLMAVARARLAPAARGVLGCLGQGLTGNNGRGAMPRTLFQASRILPSVIVDRYRRCMSPSYGRQLW